MATKKVSGDSKVSPAKKTEAKKETK